MGEGHCQSFRVQLIGGTELTQVERDAYNHLIEQRTAFTHLTSNTDAVIPVELQTQIFTLIDNTAVLYGDIHKDNFPHQFELIRHKSIKAGDAAKTDEGAAPTDEEQNEFDIITLTGEEIKKTVKMSRKMAVQSINGFEQYIVNETGARLAVAATLVSTPRPLTPRLAWIPATRLPAPPLAP